MPLFVLISGYYLRTGKINIKMRNNIVSIIFVGIVCLACILGYYPDNANVLLKGADPYTLSDLPAKILLLICTLICVCSLWVLKCEVHFLAKIGENSLLYYLLSIPWTNHRVFNGSHYQAFWITYKHYSRFSLFSVNHLYDSFDE